MADERRIIPKVVILGAGFGGLWAARTLAHSFTQVTIVDAQNYHMFVPLLYQVAAAELQPEDIAYPVRSIFRDFENIRFVMGRATQINLSKKVIGASGRDIPYDFLVLAIGSASNFFGVPGAEEYAFPLKTLDQGVALRNHILKCFERAQFESDPQKRRQLLTFAVVGGGPTGVEFAGALVELIRGPLRKDYRNIDSREPRVILCHSRERLIPDLPEKLSLYALERLRNMGVEVRLKSKVSWLSREAAYHEENEMIPTATVVWTAGVRGKPDVKEWGLPVMKTGQIIVLPTLQVKGHLEIYGVGDLAYFNTGEHPLPMLATVAIQQGIAAANNIKRQTDSRAVSAPFSLSGPRLNVDDRPKCRCRPYLRGDL